MDFSGPVSQADLPGRGVSLLSTVSAKPHFWSVFLHCTEVQKVASTSRLGNNRQQMPISILRLTGANKTKDVSNSWQGREGVHELFPWAMFCVWPLPSPFCLVSVLASSGCHNQVPQTGWFKPQTFLLSHFRKPNVYNQLASTAGLPTKPLGMDPPLPLPASGRTFLRLWPCDSNFHLCLHVAVFPRVCVQILLLL